MKRPYKKKNLDYWASLKEKKENTNNVIFTPTPNINYEWDGEESFASVSPLGNGTVSRASYRDGRAPSVTPADSFSNIEAGLLPWEAKSGKVSISKAILLCQKAAANVAIIRNTIETCCEFSNSPIHVKTSNVTVKSFFEAWFERINLYKLVDNFMREYYRSGNVFLYKFVGKLKSDQYSKVKKAMGAKSDILPIRYIILNPAQVYLEGGISYNSNNWVKVLSSYEIERLKNPQTIEDQQIFNSLPKNIQESLKAGATHTGGVYIPLDSSRLYYVFYKKQDYEPLAVPMIYPVLNDIEQKLELKKMDMALSRTIEHVILLVTTGEKKDQYGGGVNPANVAALQSMFKNQTLGRTLVADHTTKAQWVIPDISAILGPEKYKQVEKDIQEGLQSIFGSTDEKFANAQIKAKIFLERMKEAQKSFLNNFLMPEVRKICETMNFKNVPELEFETLSLDDPAIMARIYTQLLQLGVLTPDQVTVALRSGILPDKEAMEIAQKEYKKQRDDGLYQPLVGGSGNDEEAVPKEGGRPSGINTKIPNKKVGPIGKSTGSEDKFSIKKLTELTLKADKLKNQVFASLKKYHKIKEDLNESQIYVGELLAKSIISNEKDSAWTNKTIAAYIESPKEISKEIAAEIDDISYRYDTSAWEAALLRNCRIE